MTPTVPAKLTQARSFIDQVLQDLEDAGEALVTLPAVRAAIRAAEALGAATATSAITGLLPPGARTLGGEALAWAFGNVERELDEALSFIDDKRSLEAEAVAAGAGDPNAPLVKASAADGAAAVAAAMAPPDPTRP